MSENRRVKMTKKLIKDAYLELLERYPSEKVTVTDICRVADVNRSTFYMYYEDTVLLRREIENDILEQIPVLVGLPDCISSDKQLMDVLGRFFAYIKDNERMFRVLLLQSDNRSFNRRLITTVLEKYNVESDTENSIMTEYEYVYIVSGAIGVMGAWIEGGFAVTPQQMAEMIFMLADKTDKVASEITKSGRGGQC